MPACIQCRQKRRKYDKKLPCSSCKQGGVTRMYKTMPGPLSMECYSIRQRCEKDMGALRARTERLGELEQVERPSQARNPSKARLQAREYHLSSPQESVQAWPCITALLKEAGADDGAHYAERQEDRLGRLFRDLTMVEGGLDCLSCPETGFAAGGPRTLATDMPDVSGTRIRRLYGKYMKHVYPMQPFLDTTQLRESVDNFILRQNARSQADTSSDTSSNACGEYIRPRKRRRLSRRPITKSTPRLEDAIVLLILALGEASGRTQSSWTADPHAKTDPDLSKIPGLAYYGTAIRLIGSHHCIDALDNARISLLAGMFTAQYAQSSETMAWYMRASRLLVDLVDGYKLYDEGVWSGHGDANDVEELCRKSWSISRDERQRAVVLAA
jgi:hypothetical protein